MPSRRTRLRKAPTAHRCAGIELLSHGYEADTVLLEDADHARKVQQRTAEPVHFVHNHAIHTARFDGGHEPSQRRAVHMAAARAAIVILVGQCEPPFLALTQDVGFGCLALRVQRVEGLL